MSKTTWQEVYRDSARYAAIESVFALIKVDALVTDIWAKTNRVMRNLNAEERDALPAFVRAALVDRGQSGLDRRRWAERLADARVREG